MSVPCFFCSGPVNPHDEGVWKQITAWVTGPKSDGPRLREYTDRFAHAACGAKAAQGVPADVEEII